jgi:hypothetical protein
MANSFKRPPKARAASRAAALDCKEFKSSTASLYDLVDMSLETKEDALSVDERERKKVRVDINAILLGVLMVEAQIT